MITDTEIKRQGVEILASHLGEVEMERFIALIQREPSLAPRLCLGAHGREALLPVWCL